MKRSLPILLTFALLMFSPSLLAQKNIIYKLKIADAEVTELNKLGNALALSGKTGWPVTAGEIDKIEVYGVSFIITDTLKRIVGNDEIRTLVHKTSLIRLRDLGLNGSIPELSLPELLLFHLGNNNITGVIPKLNFPKCTTLYLADNKLTGTIPDFTLSQLQELSVANNKLTGTVPGLSLMELRSLHLYGNQLTGPMPDLYLPKLQFFSVYKNQITGSIPPFHLPELIVLDLAENQFSGPVPMLNLPKVREIHFEFNRLTGAFPSLTMPDAIYLFLQNNLLDGPIGKLTMPKLTTFDATDNKITGDFDNSDLTALVSLKLNNNNISGLPKLQTHSPNITIVEVANCRLTFEDLETNMDIPLFKFQPQQQVETFEGVSNNRKILYVKVGGTKNKYQWIKRKENKFSPIEGATDDTLYYVPEADASYRCVITNTLVTSAYINSTLKTPASCIKISLLEFCQMEGVWQSAGTNTVSSTGIISVNGTFFFEGTMSIDTVDLEMMATGKFYFRDIQLPGGGTGNYILSEGEHNLKLLGKDGIITNFLNAKQIQEALLFGIQLNIDSIQLVKRQDTLGARISCKISIPFFYEGCGDEPGSTDITLRNLVITNKGWSLPGFDVENLGLFNIKDFCLDRLTYDFRLSENRWLMGADLTVPLLFEKLGVGFQLKNGQVDSIALRAELRRLRIPFKPPGNTIKGLYGHIAGLTKVNKVFSRDFTKLDFKLGGIFTPFIDPDSTNRLYEITVDGRIYHPKIAAFSMDGKFFKPPKIGDDFYLPFQVALNGKLDWMISDYKFLLDFSGTCGTLDEEHWLMSLSGNGIIDLTWSPFRITMHDEGFISLPKIADTFPFDWLDSYIDFPVKLGVTSFISGDEPNLRRGLIFFEIIKDYRFELGFNLDHNKKLLEPGFLTFPAEIDPRILEYKAKSGSATGDVSKTFQVGQNTDFTVLEVQSPQTSPPSSLKDPSGKIFTSSSPADRVFLSASTSGKEVFWSLLHPKTGIWTITLQNPGVNDSVLIYNQTKKSDFHFTVSQTGKTITVTWDTSRVGTGKRVELQLDADTLNFDGNVQVDCQANQGLATISLNETMQKCRYFVGGRLIGDYWSSDKYAPVTIENPFATLLPPGNFNYTYNRISKTFDFTWVPVPSEKISGYILSLTNAQGYDSVVATVTRETNSLSLTLKEVDARKAKIESFGFDGSVGCASISAPLTTRSESYPSVASVTPRLEVYPNPTSGKCALRFLVSRYSRCDITITDISGHTIAHPVSGNYHQGYHQVEFDYGHLTGGIYFIRFTDQSGSYTVKSVLNRR